MLLLVSAIPSGLSGWGPDDRWGRGEERVSESLALGQGA